MSYQIENENENKIEEIHNKIIQTMPERIGKVNEKAANMAIDLARSNLQNNGNISTGELLASIQILENNNNGLDILIGSYKKQAFWIEYGRGPVKPVTAKVLHWKDKETGEDVFSTFAGPTEPSPYFMPAIIVIQKKYPQILVEYESDFIRILT